MNGRDIPPTASAVGRETAPARAVSAFPDRRPVTNVYVDAFNLYYGCLKNSPYKWLDLSALCHHLLPSHHVKTIRYFTARVEGRADDPQKPQRQQTYIRALHTIPNVKVHYGHFLSNVTRMPLAHPVPGKARTVEVVKTEEKGSDVNLATYLLVDAFRKNFEVGVVISNDSDLKLPIEIVQHMLKLPVGIINPHPKPSNVLVRVAAFYKPIREGVLQASQFALEISDRYGVITKPPEWNTPSIEMTSTGLRAGTLRA